MALPNDFRRELSPRTPSTATAAQKAEAVLKVWAERSSPSRICREMNITWTILNHWQDRALAGMQEALTDRPAGRKAAQVDAEKEQLKEQVETLAMKLELARKTIEVKNIIAAFEARQKSLLSDSAMPGKKNGYPTSNESLSSRSSFRNGVAV